MQATHVVIRTPPPIGPLGLRQPRTSRPMAHALAVQVARFHRAAQPGWEVEVRAVARGGAA